MRVDPCHEISSCDLCCRLEDAREELDEFQMSSRELEAELEAQLEQAEVKNKELLSANGRLNMEVEMLRVRIVNRWPFGLCCSPENWK